MGVPPTPAPRTLAPYTIPRRTPPTPTPASSSQTDTPGSRKKKIAGLMDIMVENPYARPSLLESPSPPPTPGPNPPGTPQHSSRPSRTTTTPTSSKRDRSKSALDTALGKDDLRHSLNNPVKRPKFVEPSPPPKPSPLWSKNPSALLVIGQCLPALIRDNLPGRICTVCQAQGEFNTSVFTMAPMLNTFLLQHPAHHTLIILTDFPWWTMALDDKASFINMMVKTTRNICANHHTHPSLRSCKSICLNLYQDCASSGDLVARDNLVWAREQLDTTLHLLESLNALQHSNKFAFPSLQSLYGEHSLEELFDSNNMPSPEFLHSIRSFIGDLVYRHFGNSWVQKSNFSLCCVTLPPRLFAPHLYTWPFIFKTLLVW